MTAAPAASPSLAPAARPPVVRRWHWVILAVILAVAAGLRVHGLTAEGFWLDELYSLEFSAGHGLADLYIPHDQVVRPPLHLSDLASAPPAPRIWTTLRDDPHPPLYYLTLRLWRDLFGSSDAACRSLSLVASLATIALLFDVGRLLFTPGVALWACAICAAAQPQIRYAQEARSYALLSALTLAAAAAVIRIERLGPSRRRVAALFFSLLGVMLTHYFGVAGCLALGLYALLRLRGRPRRLTLAVMAAAALAYCVLWLPSAVQQLHGYASTNNAWLSDPGPGRLLRWARRLAYTPLRLLADPSTRHPGLLPYVSLTLLLLPVARLRRVPALLLPTLLAVGVFAFVAGLDLVRATRQLDFIRYVLAAAPALYLCAAGLLADQRRAWLRHALPAALLAYCVLSLPWTYDNPKQEFRRLGHLAARAFGPDDVVLYPVPRGPRFILPGVLCVTVEHYAPHVTTPAVLLTKPLEGPALDRARAARNVWLVTSDGGDDAEIPRLVPGFHPAQIAENLLGIGTAYRLAPDDAATPTPAETRTSSTPTTRSN